ncbi:hypothetical protein BC938DRAFT_472221 [Jimgerdemannia flammicorona]|uniref:Uncharacterized protein n=1 Tax=Jimgerdemannia flammicorona TaxID=994334 RepID=A0A433Q6M4_9FUNG|nr:hypothetical protein BC938DRAFT_472221 [Jimgerdemannia flammicorona]
MAKAGVTVRNKYLKEYDMYFSFISKFKGLKHFSKGVCNLEQMTANEFFNITTQIFLSCAHGFILDPEGKTADTK